jgi:hypothetical protein
MTPEMRLRFQAIHWRSPDRAEGPAQACGSFGLTRRVLRQKDRRGDSPEMVAG